MLVLERRIEEEIVVGDAVRFRILAISGTKVKVGVIAPEGMRIWRGELAAGPGAAKHKKGKRADGE